MLTVSHLNFLKIKKH